MQEIKIGSDQTFAKILPEQGGILSELVLNCVSVINCPSPNSEGFQNFYYSAFLFPFQGRIADGKYHFEGKNYQLAINEPARNNAIHGFVAHEKFEILHVSSNSVELIYKYDGNISGYPFPFDLLISYSINNESLQVCFAATNIGTSNMPCSFGWHPYFKMHNTIDDLSLKIPTAESFLLNEKMMPIGKKVGSEIKDINLNNRQLDDCFLFTENLAMYCIELISPKNILKIKADKVFNYLMIYTPESRKSVAIEPLTAGINSFNDKSNIFILAPEEKLTGKITISLSDLLV